LRFGKPGADRPSEEERQAALRIVLYGINTSAPGAASRSQALTIMASVT
jgi:hypothetical protein